MKHLKKILTLLPIVFILSFSLPINNYTFAEDIDVDYYIIPRITNDEITKINDLTEEIGSEAGKVNEKIQIESTKLTTAQCLNSWIINRNCIMNYLVFVIKFLGQFWLVVWTGFIMYAGYKYMLSVFNWNRTSPEIVKNAIIWVIIVVFSYAIMKTLTSIVWLS